VRVFALVVDADLHVMAAVADLAVENGVGHLQPSIALSNRANPSIAQAYSGQRRRGTHRYQHDFRGHSETKWQDAAAEPAGDDYVAIDPDVAVGEAVAIARRHDR